jgi:hypothetical protein
LTATALPLPLPLPAAGDGLGAGGFCASAIPAKSTNPKATTLIATDVSHVFEPRTMRF